MTACAQVDSTLSKAGFVSRPTARRRIIVDKVSQSRGQPGYEVTVDTTSLAAFLKDAAGRTGHLIGIRLETAVVTTNTAAVPVTPLTGHALRGLIYNVMLQGQDGHQYLRKMDGRGLIFDKWAREGIIVNSPPLGQDYNPDVANPFARESLQYPAPNMHRSLFGLNPTDNTGNGTVTVRDVSIDIPLIGKYGLAGIIPLADLVENSGQLLFTLRGQMPYGAAADYPITRYEVVGEVATAVRVVFDVLYIDGVVTSRRWLVDDYTTTIVDGPFKYPGFRHRYIAARWREEDTRQGGADLTDPIGALVNANSIANLQVTLGGVSEIMGLTATQLLSRLRMILESYPDGEINTWNRAGALPAMYGTIAGANANGTDPMVRLTEFFVPYQSRPKNCPTGAVAYSMDAAAIPNGGLLRILHRVEGELTDAPIASAQSCGCTVHEKPRIIVDEMGNELLTTAKKG